MKTLWDAVVTGVTLCLLFTILVASGAADAVSTTFGGPHITSDIRTLFRSPSLSEPTTAGDAGSIRVVDARPDGYARTRDFGGWASWPAGGSAASTRDRILARDLKDVRRDGVGRVVSGVLHDPYTGRTIMFRRGAGSSAVQIDHVVALQDAWASEARDWSQARRITYANDPDVLLAVDGRANMEKGAGVDFTGRGRYAGQRSGLADVWMPSNRAYRCEYLRKRVRIRVKYGLSWTSREKTETMTALRACPA